MTKRKRTPPPALAPAPAPKDGAFTMPESLRRLAVQCRQLRESSERMANDESRPPPLANANESLPDFDVDAQLNDQLNASLYQSLPATAPTANARNPRAKQAGNTSNPSVALSDEEIRQSIIRDAEQQLGITSTSGAQPITHAHSAFQASEGLGQHGYLDESSNTGQIRFDPYLAPGQTPYYFATNQMAPNPYTMQSSNLLPSQPYGYSNQPAPQSGSYGPYVNIAPHPSTEPSQSATQQFNFPVNQAQPGYYRLPPSYWRQPPPPQADAMTDANHRAMASTSAASATLPVTQDMDLMNAAATMNGRPIYPADPSAMDLTGQAQAAAQAQGGVMTGGVFRNLTKEKFGRYSVGGRLVGSSRQIYGQ